jgi:hypothetical protein
LSHTTIKRRVALNGLCEEAKAALAIGSINLSQAEAMTLGNDEACRRPIKMSPLCQLQMTLPGGFPGGVWGDGSADERSGAAAARGAAGFASGKIDGRSGGQLLGLERRQVFRLLKAYWIEGPTGLISKRRGRRSNRRKPEALRQAVLTIIRQWYWDFGPTLAVEKLREDHRIAVGRETLRQWMIEAGLWRDRKQRQRVHQPRPRRDCVGELVQVDGSEHWWFEDRGPQCTLLVFVDDATSWLMHLQFVESESTFAYSMRPAPIWRPGASRSRSTATSMGSSGSTIQAPLAVTG